jgi:hypothetical protein
MKCILNVEPTKTTAILAKRHHLKYVFEKFRLHLFSCQKDSEDAGDWWEEKTKLGVEIILTLMSPDNMVHL